MSLGVNLLLELSKVAARVLGSSFDIEIVEMHHNQKLDAPSGTALMLADGISQEVDHAMRYEYDRHSKRCKRDRNEIGIHAVRGGTIVGEPPAARRSSPPDPSMPPSIFTESPPDSIAWRIWLRESKTERGFAP